MIIDVHNHVGTDCCDAYGSSLAPEAFVETLDGFGIDRGVCFPFMHHHGYRDANAEVAEMAKAHPRLVGFGRVDPLDGQAHRELDQIQELGLKGVKIHTRHFRMDAPQLKPLLDAIAETRLPLIVHTGVPHNAQAERMAPVVQRHDFEAVILAHAGKFHWEGAARLAAEHDEVYLDTSVQTMFKIKRAVDICGPEKVLFASDQPYSHPAVELPKIELAVPDRGDRAKVLGGNAKRVLGL